MKEKDFIMNESGDYSEKFSECLDYGETILWTGKNEIKSTAGTRLLGLAVLVFTVACFAAVYSSGSNFWIVIVPFIVVGLALTFGKNSDYYYALTDKRLIYFTFKKPSYINYEDIINIELKKEEKKYGDYNYILSEQDHEIGRWEAVRRAELPCNVYFTVCRQLQAGVPHIDRALRYLYRIRSECRKPLLLMYR